MMLKFVSIRLQIDITFKGKYFYRNKNNKEVNNTKRYVFLNGKEMLEENNENFLLLNINEKDDVLVVSLYGYESGRSLTCYYRNNKLIKKRAKW